MPVVFLQRVANALGQLISPQLRAIKLGNGLTVTAKPDDTLVGSSGGDGQVTGYYEVEIDVGAAVTFSAVNAALGTADADINVNGQKIVNLGNPTSSADAATKFYVDANAVPTSRSIFTTAPLTGGGSLATNLTLAISPASGAAAGSMSAAHYSLVNGAVAVATGDTLVRRRPDGSADFGGNSSFDIGTANTFQAWVGSFATLQGGTTTATTLDVTQTLHVGTTSVFDGVATFASGLSVNNQQITSLGAPSAATDAATKGYADMVSNVIADENDYAAQVYGDGSRSYWLLQARVAATIDVWITEVGGSGVAANDTNYWGFVLLKNGSPWATLANTKTIGSGGVGDLGANTPVELYSGLSVAAGDVIVMLILPSGNPPALAGGKISVLVNP